MYATLIKRNRAQHTVECPAITQDEVYDGLIYLELRGPQEATRAMWAHLVRHRRERSVVKTNVHINQGLRTFAVAVLPGRSKYHKRILGDRLIMINHRADKVQREFLLEGTKDEPSPWFVVAVQQKIDVPFLSQWTKIVWQEAIKKELIKQIPAWEMSCWQLVSQDWRWQEMIENLWKGGKINYGQARSH